MNVLHDAASGELAHRHDSYSEPHLAQVAAGVLAVDRLGEREPLAPHDGQPEDVDAAPHVVAGQEHDLV
eukprot:7989227-Heterocapsa_arctica.AAC.1